MRRTPAFLLLATLVAGCAAEVPPPVELPPPAPAPAGRPAATATLPELESPGMRELVLGQGQAIDWRTASELPDVDFSGLDAAQKQAALTVLREEGCPCGCGMKLAECRIHDRSCPLSPGLAATVVREIRAGKPADEVRAALAAAAPGQAPAGTPPPPPPLLGEPVAIPIDGDPFKGPASARVTIVEFSDFECPYCARATEWIDAVAAAYPQDVKLVFKQYPLPFHRNARLAAEAALAAQAQGKFWELHDKMFANYRSLGREDILKWAGELGMDVKQLAADLDSGKYAREVEADMEHGTKAGVSGTPTFFLNGRQYGGARELDAIRPLIEAELKKGS